MRKILLILPILAVISCSGGEKPYHLSDKNIENSENVSALLRDMHNSNLGSREEVFGKNEIISRFWIDEKGNFVKSYSFTHHQNSILSYIPIISLFMPRHYNNYEVMMVFDKKSKKVQIIDFFNQVTVKSSLFCDPPSSSCISSVKY